MKDKTQGRPPLPADEKLQSISARLSKKEIAILDSWVADGLAGSRSEAIRWAVRSTLPPFPPSAL